MNDEIHHKILLVDDNPADVALFKQVFPGQENLDLHVVPDGDAAMAFLRREGEYSDAPRPNLILLDLNLPGMDGRGVLAKVKGDESLRQIPVVILTSSQSEEDVSKCYDLHANAYMRKARDLDGLIALTEEISRYWLSLVVLPP